MNRFTVVQPKSYTAAVAAAREPRFSLAIYKAGGMDVVDHLKEGLWEPDALVDVKRLRRPGRSTAISMMDGIDRDPLLEIEAGATLTDVVESSLLRQHAPVLAQSLERAATPQVRNIGTVAGNLLQRPRCWYYRNDQFHCLKKGGATCFAVEGENRYHAVLGGGPCWIVHPSNLAPALVVCEGEVHLTGGSRQSIPIADLYHLPDKGVTTESNLQPGEIITHITCRAKPSSGFCTIKEKQSFDWPLVMAAAALELQEGVIRGSMLCAGAVAPVPWRLLEVEEALQGVALDDEERLAAACQQAVRNARPMTDNAYKLTLLPVAVKRAILRAAGRWNDPEMEA